MDYYRHHGDCDVLLPRHKVVVSDQLSEGEHEGPTHPLLTILSYIQNHVAQTILFQHKEVESSLVRDNLIHYENSSNAVPLCC